MKNLIYFISLFVLAAVFLSSCSGNTADNKNENSENTNTESFSVKDIKAGEAYDITGKVQTVDESGLVYIYNVVLELNNGETLSLKYDTENGNVYELAGKNVKINFESVKKNMMLDITIDGASIMGEYGGIATNNNEINPNWKKADGTLEATSITEGDLPDIFFVNVDGGQNLSFEYFITQEMVDNNEKQVTIYYREQNSNIINTLELAE